MPWIGPAIQVGGSLLGGLMGGGASNDAANAQIAASQAAIAEQRRQYDQNRADLAPFRDTGVAANSRLKYLLGLGGSGSESDRASLRSSLLPQFTRQENVTGDGYWTPGYGAWGDFAAVDPQFVGNQSSTRSVVDEAGLNAAIDAQSSGSNDPAYGSLVRKFSMADRDADPVYQSGLQFGLDQGKGAINERAIANGGYDSGATLKALTRFGNDYGSTKAEGAYNRYTADNNNIYNKYAGVSGAGQTAATQTGQFGANAANNISSLLTGVGNAQAAGIVGGANAASNAFGGIGSAVQGYQNNQMWNKILGNRGGGFSGANANDDYTFGYGMG